MGLDKLNRPLRDLRISLTDKCNFRCNYCMPKEIFGRDYTFLKRDQHLTFEEIYRLARIFVAVGVKKIRLTGGEPLMRRGLEVLVEKLATIPKIDLTLTTNGSFPLDRVESLKSAGLQRMTVSLDSLDETIFKAMNDVDSSVEDVLAWIEACGYAGLTPVKINTVVKRGINHESILPLARHFKGSGHIVRFIEYMDVGRTNGWRLDDVIPAYEIVDLISSEMPLEQVNSNYPGEVAKRYRYSDGNGEIGIIASVTQAFCQDCTRARLSADGSLYTCLFASSGVKLRDTIRKGRSDAELLKVIQSIWTKRSDHYSEIRGDKTEKLHRIEMSYIGG